MNFVLHSLIVHTLKKYIQNSANVQLSLFQGEISLSKISLIQKSFNQFIASFTENLRIYKGNINNLKISIPWSSLTSKSIAISASDLQINLHFSHFDQLLQAEKTFFGIKEEIKNGVYPEVDESLIQKFLNKVISNLKVKFEKIHINVDFLDIYNVQLACDELEIFNCQAESQDYEYITSKKILSKMIILRNFSVKIASKSGKELELLKFAEFRAKILMKNGHYSFELGSFQEAKVAIDLNLVRFCFEKLPVFFFQKKIITQEQPIAFLLYNNFQILKESFSFAYTVEKLDVSIIQSFEEEIASISQSFCAFRLKVRYSSGGNLQKYLVDFQKIEFSCKNCVFLALESNQNEDFQWKFAKTAENDPPESQISFELLEKLQENANLQEYDYKLAICGLHYFVNVIDFLRNLKEIVAICQAFVSDLCDFLAKLQEKKDFQRRESGEYRLSKSSELEKHELLSFPPKIAYNYSCNFLENRIEIQLFPSVSYYLYFSFRFSYKGILSRTLGKLKKLSIALKPHQIRLEDARSVKILEILNFDLLFEKYEKNARISNLKIAICEVFAKFLKRTFNDFLEFSQRLSAFLSENLETHQKNNEILGVSKDFQSNLQVKIMNFTVQIGELICLDFNEPVQEIFKEVFDVKLSKIELFGVENACFEKTEENKENAEKSPITKTKTMKMSVKIEVFFIDSLFFETIPVVNKTNVQLCLDFIETTQNKLEFLNTLRVNISPEILNNLLIMANFKEKRPVSLVKYIKNETNQALYVKSHHFLKNEQITVLDPGQSAVLALSNKKIDSQLNFYQIGRKFHRNDEFPVYSEKFFIAYDENKSIKSYTKHIVLSGPTECHLHLKAIERLENVRCEVLCVFADWYLINLLTSQKINLLRHFNDSSSENAGDGSDFVEIKPKNLKNCRENEEIIENLMKCNNKFADLDVLVRNKLFLSQQNSILDDFLDVSNEYLMANSNEENFEHIYFKKNPNFKFLTYKLYSKFENDDNPLKNLFYIDIFQKDGINFSVIKPFILISNKIDKVIYVSLREFTSQSEETSKISNKHKVLPESFHSLCSSATCNIYCTKIYVEFLIEYHNLSFQGQKILYKTYNEEKTAADSHILQFTNENNFNFDVVLFNKKIDESAILQFEYPLEILNESDYVIIIKIKKFIDPIIVQPFENIPILKHLSYNNTDSLHFSILQKGDIMFSNTNFIEVSAAELFVDKIHLLSFNFTKLNDNYLNIFLSLNFITQKEKQKLIIKPFIKIVNKTDNALEICETNTIVRPNQSYPIEFNFSCDEEFNNKFIKIGKDYIKGFCQELIRSKFFSSNKSELKIIKLILISNNSLEKKEILLNQMLSNNQTQIKFPKETFILGVYQNFIFKDQQLILYLIKNIVHDNKNYVLIDNQTENVYSMEPSFSFALKNSAELINPFSTHLMFFDERINYKSFKTNEINNNSIAWFQMPCLKYFAIRNKNCENVCFQIIIPNISIKISLEVGNEIDVNLEIHSRIFVNDKFDILVNKLKVEKNSKGLTYEILTTQGPPYIIMEKSYFPEKNFIIFKNVFIKIDKIKLILQNDTIAFLFKFIDQFYSMNSVNNQEEEKKNEDTQNINLDPLTFIYNFKLEEYKINLNVNLDPHLILNGLDVSIPVFKINNQKTSIKNFFNEVLSFFLAYLVVQLPKTTITLNQLKNPFNLISLLWNFKDKFMKTYSNIEKFQPNPDFIEFISPARFQLKYFNKYHEQLFIMLNSKKNSQSKSIKHLVLTNQYLYIISQGRIYKCIPLKEIKKIKWCYSSKVISLSSLNNKDLELLTTLRNGYRLVNVMKEVLL